MPARPVLWTVMVTGMLCSAAVAAVCDSTDACLQLIQQSQQSTRSLSARFEQTKFLSLLTEPLVSRGQFAFHKPDQILWRIDEPQRLTVRIDRSGIHLPDLPNAAAEMAAVAPFSSAMREMAGLFTGSLGTVRDAFTLQADADASQVHLHLIPRKAEWQHMLRSLDVYFAMPDLVVKSMRLDEALGDHLETVFSDIHRNDAVADAAFDASH